MRDLVFIQSVPCDTYYLWQTHMWLESLKLIGKSDKAISLVYTPKGRERNPKWDVLKSFYPEVEFFFLTDEDNVAKLLGIYLPITRPYMLMKYFKAHPEMKDKAIFYCDADILFTESFNVDKFVDDDINYVSDTLSYISASYFDSKIKDVKPERLEDYKNIDVLDEATKMVKIDRKIAEKYNLESGGAQYLLKNIDEAFWRDVIGATINIRIYLQNVNRVYFENESKGFQSWCADMWAVLWNIWAREKETKIVKEMDFAWSSDPAKNLEKPIFHNAGLVGRLQGEIPVFYKGEYHAGKNPFTDPYLESVYTNESSKSLANWYYVSKMVELKSKYDLNYLNN